MIMISPWLPKRCACAFETVMSPGLQPRMTRAAKLSPVRDTTPDGLRCHTERALGAHVHCGRCSRLPARGIPEAWNRSGRRRFGACLATGTLARCSEITAPSVIPNAPIQPGIAFALMPREESPMLRLARADVGLSSALLQRFLARQCRSSDHGLCGRASE